MSSFPEEQLALFAALWQARQAEREAANVAEEEDDEDGDTGATGTGSTTPKKKPGERQALPRHLKRERIVHDLAAEEKHCVQCAQDLRHIGEETCERYEYIPASLTVIEEACLKYACACTVRTAGKPPQPIEKSTAGASLLAQVIVSKLADHLPLHRQAKIFERHGVDISPKSMCGWMAQCADLLNPLYVAAKKVLFGSKVIGTDDTSVKVLDRKLPFARTGRIWPYYGDREHPVVLYDYTATRERAEPEKFLAGYRGYLQADAYGGYDAFFKDPARGLIEVGCWAHSRRYFRKALESDQARMGPALLLMAQLYRVEKQARTLAAEDRLQLRGLRARPILDKLYQYLLEIEAEVLQKSRRAARCVTPSKTGGRSLAMQKTEIWRSIITLLSVPSAAWRSAAATGCFFAVTPAEGRLQCCAVLSLPASALTSIPSPGSKTSSPASPAIQLTASPSFCHTTGLPLRLNLPAQSVLTTAFVPGDSRTFTNVNSRNPCSDLSVQRWPEAKSYSIRSAN